MLNLLNYVHFIKGVIVAKVSGLFEILSGFGKKISQHGRRITQIGARGSLSKLSEGRRDSKTTVDWSGDGNGSSFPKMNFHRTDTMYWKESRRSDASFKNDVVPGRAVYHIPRVGDDSTNVSLKYLQTQLMGLRTEIQKDLQRQLDEKFEEKYFDDAKEELELDAIRKEVNNQTQRVVQQLVEENKASFREIRREMKRINRKN